MYCNRPLNGLNGSLTNLISITQEFDENVCGEGQFNKV